MRKQPKKQVRSSPAGQSRPSEAARATREDSRVEETEPVAERRPVPVWLIPLLVVLVYAGDMYVMDHGADVMGKVGPFPPKVFDPFRTYDEVMAKNPESEEEKFIKIGRGKYELYCGPCHASNGLGTPATGIPPLAGSEWVKAQGPGRAIRIVLLAVRGPITVAGRQFDNPGMLAWGPQLTDEDIAAILTYVRGNNNWGNKAPMVKPEQVKKVRDAYGSRSEAFTADELAKVPETD